MISKPTRVLTVVLCLWVGAIAGIASDAKPSGPQVAAARERLGVRIEGRGDLRIGNRAQRPARSQANW